MVDIGGARSSSPRQPLAHHSRRAFGEEAAPERVPEWNGELPRIGLGDVAGIAVHDGVSHDEGALESGAEPASRVEVTETSRPGQLGE